MQKEFISTEDAPKAVGPYSQGVAFGSLVFTSGQLPINPVTGILEQDIRVATTQVIKNVQAILEAAGSSLNNVLKATVLLKNMDDFAAMNEVYSGFFGDNPPARICFQVCKLPMDACVEMEVVAFK